MAAAIQPPRPRTPSYSLDEDECSSQEEEQLLPPPQSWFEEPHSDLRMPETDSVDNIFEEHDAPPLNVICEINTEENDDDDDDSPTPNVDYALYSSMSAVGAPHKAPSWKELSSEVLPAAARELLSTSMRRVYHYSLVSYAKGRWTRKYSDLGNNAGGYFKPPQLLDSHQHDLPPFSSLPWVDRQLVQEWRTCDLTFENQQQEDDHDDDDVDFDRARTLVPKPIQKPKWQKAECCHECHRTFGPTLLRHHCRLCGKSYCQAHSAWSHRLPHLGYDADVPERVCDGCKRMLLEQNLAERVAWRSARCRDYLNGDLTPYFETGVDTVEEVALRVTKAAITMARSIPLGAQAHVAVETVEVLRKHGLKGIYGLILRKEFLAAADLLCRALGINKTAWPLSVHELSAAIFYALAQHRAMRGMSPEREHLIHAHKPMDESAIVAMSRERDESDDAEWGPFVSAWTGSNPTAREEDHVLEHSNHGEDDRESKADDSTTHNNNSTSLMDETDTYDPLAESIVDLIAMADNAIHSNHHDNPNIEGTEVLEGSRSSGGVDNHAEAELPFNPVCEPVSDPVMSSLVFYAPIALNFVYAVREVDMQLLAAQQGWRLLYAHLEQDTLDRPASALFVHGKQKIACFAVRGTATINDVVTDIRQMPIPFPEKEEDRFEDDWTPVFRGQGLAVCGMARAAVNLYREHIDALVTLAENGYRIRITGHSLGGGVATLLGALVLRHIENVANLGDSLGHAVRSESVDNAPSESVIVQRNDLLRVYGYGTPSCVDAKLSEYVKTFVTTVVLHDDVVPRLTPTSIRGLLKHLLHIRETWVKAHLTDDLMAITDRARTVWAPKWRGSFTISKPSSTKIKRYCRKQIQIGKQKLLTVKGQLVGSIKEKEASSDDEGEPQEQHLETSEETEKVIASSPNGNESPGESAEPHGVSDGSGENCSPEIEAKVNALSFESEPDTKLDSEADTRPMVDFMGGIDYRTQGVVIDGDEFFDADESLLEEDTENDDLSDSESEDNAPLFPEAAMPEPTSESEDESQDSLPKVSDDEDKVHQRGLAYPRTLGSEKATADDGWARFDTSFESSTANGQSVDVDKNKSTQPDIERFGVESEGLEESEEMGGVMLDETPLPRMFLPGKIVHIYTHRGGYKAAYVPRAFRELRRISLAGNMLSDHTSKAYYEALLEVQSVRKAEEGLPRWTAFDEDDTCSCCASRFTWASTSDSEAQEARDKHNCRSCGTLVCDPCASNRIPLPSIGINASVRVCDRCYNDMGGVLTGHSGYALTSSFMESGEMETGVTDDKTNNSIERANESEEPLSSPVLEASEMTAGSTEKQQPERQRERRSKVVDELASRINSSSVLNSTTG